MRVVVQEQPFDIGAETTTFASGHKDMGAIVTFTGIVRDLPGDPLQAMEIEHYPGMTEAALTEIAQTAIDRWALGDALVGLALQNQDLFEAIFKRCGFHRWQGCA